MSIKMQMFGIGLYQSFFHNIVISLHIFHKKDNLSALEGAKRFRFFVIASTALDVDGPHSFKDVRFYVDFWNITDRVV